MCGNPFQTSVTKAPYSAVPDRARGISREDSAHSAREEGKILRPTGSRKRKKGSPNWSSRRLTSRVRVRQDQYQFTPGITDDPRRDRDLVVPPFLDVARPAGPAEPL